MVVNGMQCSHPCNPHQRTDVLTAPSRQVPSLRAGETFSVPLHELQTKSQASPYTESFFKRLISLLGMSQEDEPFL